MREQQENLIRQLSPPQFHDQSDGKETHIKDSKARVPSDEVGLAATASTNLATGAAPLQTPAHQGTEKQLSRSTIPKGGSTFATATQMAMTGVQLEQWKPAGNETQCMVPAQQSQALKPLSSDRVSTVLDESGSLGACLLETSRLREEPCADDSSTARSYQSSDEGTGLREKQELFRVPLHYALSANSSPCYSPVTPWQIPADRAVQRPGENVEAKSLPRSGCTSPRLPPQVPAAIAHGRSVLGVQSLSGSRVHPRIRSPERTSLQVLGPASRARSEDASGQGCVIRLQSAPENVRPCR